MSALLLARAARLLGWPPDRWARGWPDLLTAHEIATLEACDDTGKPDPGKRAAILALLKTMPPDADGQAPGKPPRMVARQSSYLTGPGMAPRYDTPAPMRPAYRAATYRHWPPRDWEPGPMVASWFEWFDVLAAMTQGQGKPEPKPQKRSYTQARAESLAAVLDAIEARARECGVPLVRSEWPGTKAELRDFLKWHAPGLSYSLQTDNDRLTDELRPHGVSFLPGNNKGKGRKFYRELFPEYPAT